VSAHRLWSHLQSWGPPLLWMVVMSSLSTGPFSGEQTSRFIEPLLLWLFPGLSISTVKAIHAWTRTGAHVVEFGILSALWYRSLTWGVPGWQLRPAFLAFGLTILFAVADEIHQAFVATRFAKITDVGLDGLGALGGLALVGVVLGRAGDVKERPLQADSPGPIEAPAKD
jgi:VanZ family protein